MSFGISWSRCGARMCRCRSCPRYDRHHLPWTLPAMAEQVVADILRPGRSGETPLTVQESVTLHNGLAARLAQHLQGSLIVACPWHTGREILSIVAPRSDGAGRWDDAGPLLAPFA